MLEYIKENWSYFENLNTENFKKELLEKTENENSQYVMPPEDKSKDILFYLTSGIIQHGIG